MSGLRRKALARPHDFDRLIADLPDRENRYPPEALRSLAEQIAEQIALGKLTPPAEIAAFVARHRPAPSASARTRVRFTSTLFEPRHPEHEQVNPGRYGRELALWLGDGLRKLGVHASPPFAEDWGWMVLTDDSGASVRVGCGNVDGSRDRWLVCLEQEPPRRGLLDRLLGRGDDSPTALGAVVNAVDACLRAEQRVSDIEWHRVDGREQEHDHAPRPA